MQGTISFDGTLSGGITGGGGGGSEVTITPLLTEGEKIAEYEIDGTPGELFAPAPEGLTAQAPLSITSGVISIDLSGYQEKLTAGSYINIDSDNEISCSPPITNVWYTPEPDVQQDVLIGKFTVNEVTQNVYAPSGGGSSWNYSTTEVNTGQKWTDGKDIYCRVFNISPLTMSTAGTWYPTGCVIPDIDKLINVNCSGGGDTSYGSITADYSNDNINLINFRIAIVDTIIAFYTKSV